MTPIFFTSTADILSLGMEIITVPLKDLGSVARASKSRQKQDSLEKVAYNR